MVGWSSVVAVGGLGANLWRQLVTKERQEVPSFMISTMTMILTITARILMSMIMRTQESRTSCCLIFWFIESPWSVGSHMGREAFPEKKSQNCGLFPYLPYGKNPQFCDFFPGKASQSNYGNICNAIVMSGQFHIVAMFWKAAFSISFFWQIFKTCFLRQICCRIFFQFFLSLPRIL